MIRHTEINAQELRSLVRRGMIRFAGNSKLKIYGKLSCASGKRMQKHNRIFFDSEEEAILNGYRPCGHCLHGAYKIWKDPKTKTPH